jgi:probable rRNA maturation factor
MIRILSVRNRQRRYGLDTRLLRQLTLYVLEEVLNISEFELGIHVVPSPKMAKVNEAFLAHDGSTDVITFDYTERLPARETKGWIQKGCLARQPFPRTGRSFLHGELYICVNEAVAQSRRFRTTWQSELARYIIHGLLHLCGYDDLQPSARRKMKRAETKLVSKVTKRFVLRQIGTRRKVRAK